MNLAGRERMRQEVVSWLWQGVMVRESFINKENREDKGPEGGKEK